MNDASINENSSRSYKDACHIYGQEIAVTSMKITRYVGHEKNNNTSSGPGSVFRIRTFPLKIK
jgi:hypothetical protein